MKTTFEKLNNNKGQAPYDNGDGNLLSNFIFKFASKKLINDMKAIIVKFLNKLSCFNRRCSTGQAMLLTVLILSGAILGASTIAGYLMLLKIRSASDISNSAKAIFAADSGMEWELYKYFKEPDCSDIDVVSTFLFCSSRNLSNGSEFTVINDPENNKIKVVGESANTFRAFELEFIQ